MHQGWTMSTQYRHEMSMLSGLIILCFYFNEVRGLYCLMIHKMKPLRYCGKLLNKNQYYCAVLMMLYPHAVILNVICVPADNIQYFYWLMWSHHSLPTTRNIFFCYENIATLIWVKFTVHWQRRIDPCFGPPFFMVKIARRQLCHSTNPKCQHCNTIQPKDIQPHYTLWFGQILLNLLPEDHDKWIISHN